MNFDPNSVSAIAAVVGVVASLIIFIWQSRTQVRHIKAQVSAELTARLNESNAIEIGHPELSDFRQTLFTGQTKENHTSVLISDMRLALFEEVFVQYKKFKLLDEEDWNAWRAILAQWIEKPFFEGYWKISSPSFRASFVSEVAAITEELSKTQAHRIRASNATASG